MLVLQLFLEQNVVVHSVLQILRSDVLWKGNGAKKEMKRRDEEEGVLRERLRD